MNLGLTKMTSQEQMYSYTQSQQIMSQTACIGHLRGDFDWGQSFYTTWSDHNAALKTDEFKAELNNVVAALREKDELLSNLKTMSNYCWKHMDAKMETSSCNEFGFKLKTEKYTYLLRCNPNVGDTNFYIYIYVTQPLEFHLERAKQGIRFINSDYKELFRIQDGDKIRIFTGSGETRDRTCRFIDTTHFETSGEYSSAVYHICEFAERLERSNGSVIPLRSSLPTTCFSVLPSSGELIVITRGERGYSLASLKNAEKSNQELAEMENKKRGITKSQEAAMLAGSMFGWHTPAADPDNYDEEGRPMIRKK